MREARCVDLPDEERIRALIESAVAEWRATLSKRPVEARTLLKLVVDGRFVFTPRRNETSEFYEFTGTGRCAASHSRDVT